MQKARRSALGLVGDSDQTGRTSPAGAPAPIPLRGTALDEASDARCELRCTRLHRCDFLAGLLRCRRRGWRLCGLLDRLCRLRRIRRCCRLFGSRRGRWSSLRNRCRRCGGGRRWNWLERRELRRHEWLRLRELERLEATLGAQSGASGEAGSCNSQGSGRDANDDTNAARVGVTLWSSSNVCNAPQAQSASDSGGNEFVLHNDSLQRDGVLETFMKLPLTTQVNNSHTRVIQRCQKRGAAQTGPRQES